MLLKVKQSCVKLRVFEPGGSLLMRCREVAAGRGYAVNHQGSHIWSGQWQDIFRW